MKVSQVIEQARTWVEEYGRQLPGFVGAHLIGGLNGLSKEESFSSFRDVDIGIVLEDPAGRGNLVTAHQGLVLEAGFFGLEAYRSPEVVLSNPSLASNLAVDGILVDPTGQLRAVHQVVAREYARPRWIRARCDAKRQSVLSCLQAMATASRPEDRTYLVAALVSQLASLVAVANLRPPTFRRGLALARELLHHHGHSTLHEELLAVGGYAQLDREQVESFLPDIATAFDLAVRIKRSRTPYGFKLHPHLRPYFLEGSREIIQQGFHREAMFWIQMCFYVSYTAIQSDAPDELKPPVEQSFDRLRTAVGLTGSDWEARQKRARGFFETLSTEVDRMQYRDDLGSHGPLAPLLGEDPHARVERSGAEHAHPGLDRRGRGGREP